MKWPVSLSFAWVLSLVVLVLGHAPSATAQSPHGLMRQLPATRNLVVQCLKLFAPDGCANPHGRTFQLLQQIQTRAGKVILLPEDCFAGESEYDLVVHFHGVHTALEPALSVSGLRAAMLITTDGIGAEVYANKYQFEHSLPTMVAGVERAINERCPERSRTVRRIALSAWSAGYGAISRILRWKENFDRVDAVLLADGLHAPYTAGGTIHDSSMKHFLAYAQRATEGKALFALTHTAIVTPGYASTTETADFLLRRLGVRRTLEDSVGPRRTMRRLYHADGGDFHVQGYGGDDPAAHAAHQHALGETLLPLLASYWQTVPASGRSN